MGQHAVAQTSNMARMGNHREAQAYTKNIVRKMKAQGRTSEQMESRDKLVDNFGSLYQNIGKQDQLEQNAALSDSGDEMEDEEMIQPKASSTFFGMFGGGGSKGAKPVPKKKAAKSMAVKQ